MNGLDISATALWLASFVIGSWCAWNLGSAIKRRSTSLAWHCGITCALSLGGMVFATLVLEDVYPF